MEIFLRIDAAPAPQKEWTDRMDKLVEMARIEAASRVLERFLDDFEQHMALKAAGVKVDPRWVQDYPEKFVKAIDLAQRMAEIR